MSADEGTVIVAETVIRHTFPKEEHLCGKTSISRLMSKGRWGGTEHLKYCFVRRSEGGCNRLMVSVPKKLFKRAVKRNLLKRRLRESYRLHKFLLKDCEVDMMLLYNCPGVLDSKIIAAEVEEILNRIGSHVRKLQEASE